MGDRQADLASYTSGRVRCQTTVGGEVCLKRAYAHCVFDTSD